MNSNVRNSNIELLRIFAMAGILFGHGVGMANSLPTRELIMTDPISSFFFVSASSVFVGGVNVFVLISGWFGIHATFKGMMKLLFQFFFMLWGVILILLIGGQIRFEHLTWNNCLGLTDGYWFVVAYIALYILSPMLNLFAEQATKRQLQLFLASFYTFQCYCSWLSSYFNYFNGYSIVMFVGLYLTARYFKRFPVKFITKHPGSLYVGLVMCSTFVLLFSLYTFGNAARMLRYDNPIVVLECICLILLFQKIKIQSKIINWLAASCFSVYILHIHPYVFDRFLCEARYIRVSLSDVNYVLGISLFLIVVFLACVLVDQLRIFFWHHIVKR